jgi:hypothetical protein
MHVSGSCSLLEPRHHDASTYQAQIQSRFDAASGCERSYVSAHIQSAVTAFELSDAAIAACDQQVSSAVDAYMSDLIARMADERRYFDIPAANSERSRFRVEITERMRNEALRLAVDGRTPAASPPMNASDAGTLRRVPALSPHQLKQAIRVAKVPEADFERQVESERPPRPKRTGSTRFFRILGSRIIRK